MIRPKRVTRRFWTKASMSTGTSPAGARWDSSNLGRVLVDRQGLGAEDRVSHRAVVFSAMISPTSAVPSEVGKDIGLPFSVRSTVATPRIPPKALSASSTEVATSV